MKELLSENMLRPVGEIDYLGLLNVVYAFFPFTIELNYYFISTFRNPYLGEINPGYLPALNYRAFELKGCFESSFLCLK